MSKTVVPTQPQRVSIFDENEELLEKIILSDLTWDENTIMGNVSDKLTGKPIEGVCIKICDYDYKPIAYNFTDVDGNFTLQALFSTSIRIIASKRGYETFSSDNIPSSSIEKKTLNLELKQSPSAGAVVFGSIRDSQQKPLSGIKITIFKSHSMNPYDFTFTNEEGLFVFDNIEPGVYRISSQSQSYHEKVINIEARNDQPIIVLETLYLRKKTLKGTLHGIITDSNGLPVENALVVLCNSNNMPLQVTHTNDKGVYLFYKLEPGTYSVMAK